MCDYYVGDDLVCLYGVSVDEITQRVLERDRKVNPTDCPSIAEQLPHLEVEQRDIGLHQRRRLLCYFFPPQRLISFMFRNRLVVSYSRVARPIITPSSFPIKPLYQRFFSGSKSKMSDLEIELTAPNGRKYKQPIGLFINNEWVKSTKGEKITTINPTYCPLQWHQRTPPPANQWQ